MPKYIRTKDERIVDFSQCKVCEHLVGKPLSPKRGHLIYPEDIIKQADTIEELCDEFVMYDKQFGEKTRYIHKCIDIPVGDRNKYVIYSAVWTDKGLIYVAKMNEKGELELL